MRAHESLGGKTPCQCAAISVGEPESVHSWAVPKMGFLQRYHWIATDYTIFGDRQKPCAFIRERRLMCSRHEARKMVSRSSFFKTSIPVSERSVRLPGWMHYRYTLLVGQRRPDVLTVLVGLLGSGNNEVGSGDSNGQADTKRRRGFQDCDLDNHRPASSLSGGLLR